MAQKESLLAEKEEALEKERALHNKTFEEALFRREEELKAVLNEEFVKQLQVIVIVLYILLYTNTASSFSVLLRSVYYYCYTPNRQNNTRQ